MAEMERSFGANEVLLDIMAQFISVVDERITALGMQVDKAPASGREDILPPIPEPLVEGACNDLMREIRHRSEPGTLTYRNFSPDTIAEFTYLMAAWVDEALVRTFRERLPRGYSSSVEHLLFGSLDAGERIFTRIEQLVARRSSSDISLAGVYLLILSLGFRGQYPDGASDVISRYHRELSAIAALPPRRVVRAIPAPLVNVAQKTPFHQQSTAIWAILVIVWIVAILAMEIGWMSIVNPVKNAVPEFQLKKVSDAEHIDRNPLRLASESPSSNNRRTPYVVEMNSEVAFLSMAESAGPSSREIVV